MFQSKVDNLGMYHALAKKLVNYNGGTYIKNNLATYIEMHKDKYRVRRKPRNKQLRINTIYIKILSFNVNET